MTVGGDGMTVNMTARPGWGRGRRARQLSLRVVGTAGRSCGWLGWPAVLRGEWESGRYGWGSGGSSVLERIADIVVGSPGGMAGVRAAAGWGTVRASSGERGRDEPGALLEGGGGSS